MNSSSNISIAHQAFFQAALPEGAVITGAEPLDRFYRRNATALHRDFPFVLRPGSEAEVVRLLAVANAHRLPLHPFSTGRNWGLGSKLPVTDGCIPVDLSALNRIVEVSDEFAYVILEPGVTQAQLAAYLQEKHPRLTLNFTGSFGHTGIVGNVLERGDGGHARVEDLLGVRGFLGDGTPFQAGGFWDHVGQGRPSHHSRFRAGPDLCGLFCQSNLGLVTELAFRLMPRQERRCLFFGTAPDENLERVVDAFARLGEQGVVNRGSVNIGYANRFVQAAASMQGGGAGAMPAAASWNFYALVAGSTRLAEAAVEELQEALGPLCDSTGCWRVNPQDNPREVLPEFLQPLAQPLAGVPDTESIKLIYRLTGTPLPERSEDMDVDHTPFGMKSCLPVVPPRGRYARLAAGIVAAQGAAFGLNVKLSFFGDGRVLITIHFRLDDPDQVRRAEDCERALWDALIAAGFPPYRVGIDQMSRLPGLEPAFFELVARLKSALDPRHVLSPGRYCPVAPLGPQAP